MRERCYLGSVRGGERKAGLLCLFGCLGRGLLDFWLESDEVKAQPRLCWMWSLAQAAQPFWACFLLSTTGQDRTGRDRTERHTSLRGTPGPVPSSHQP